MQKIPTLFVRDPENMSRVLDEPNTACLWVFAGEGVATRKWDGTCVKLGNYGTWWARREVKPGKAYPDQFVKIETDPATMKTVGWEPIEKSGFYKHFLDARAHTYMPDDKPGTYELVGPKINGNPDGFEHHTLVRHGWTKLSHREFLNGVGRSYDELQRFFQHDRPEDLAHIEGIVYHHPDGRMAKIKARDFR